MRVFLTARAPLSRTWVTGSSIVSTSMAACGAVSSACRWEADGRTGRCSINGWTADATKFPPPSDFLVVSRRGHWQQPIQGPAGAIDSAGAAQKILDNRAGVPPTPPSRRRTLLCAPARTYIYLLAAVSTPDSRLRPFSTRILSVTTGRRSSTSPWRRSRSASRQAATARCLSRSPIRTAPPQRCRTSPSSPKPPPSTS